MKEQIIEFLKPNRKKVAITILLPHLMAIFTIILVYILEFLYKIGPTPFSEIREIMAIDLKLIFKSLIFSIEYYPFVCSLFAIVKSYRAGKIKAIYSDKTWLSLILIGLIIFNPITIYILNFTVLLFFLAMQSYPIPMVEIVEMSPDTPLKNLEVGDKIYEITIIKHGEKYREIRNNVTYIDPNVTARKTFIIRNSSDFYQAMEEAKGWDVIYFQTLRKRFGFKINKNITDRGIEVKDIEYRQWLL